MHRFWFELHLPRIGQNHLVRRGNAMHGLLDQADQRGVLGDAGAARLYWGLSSGGNPAGMYF